MAGRDSAAEWVEGRFEGTYTGERVSGADESGELRRFSFELISGRVESLAPSPAPTSESDRSDDRTLIRQDRVRNVELAPPADGGCARVLTLFDVRISDFALRHPAEVNGRSFGTVVGRIRARLRPPRPKTTAEPVPPTSSRLQRPRSLAPPPVDETPVGLETERAYRRLRWWLALVVVAICTALVGWHCDRQLGAIFAAPLLGALVLRALARSVLLTPRFAQVLFAVFLIGAQAYGLWPAAEAIWNEGCAIAAERHLAWVAVPVVLAGWLRVRWPLAVTAFFWTATVCISCGAMGGACATSALATPEAVRAPASRPPSRTDPEGRWPAPPGQWDWSPPRGSAPGVFDPGAQIEGAPVVDLRGGGSGRIGIEGETSVPVAPGSDRSASVSVDAPEETHVVSLPSTVPRPAGGAAPLSEIDPSPVNAAPHGTAARGAPSGVRGVPGGWVAPDHRSAEREMTLISIEQANRSPAEFFESAGRRVYLPTDPIFEAGGSRIRQKGALSLSRLAALLALHTEQRIVLEFHTDTGGSEEAQRGLSERRAGAVRAWLVDRGHVDPTRFEVVGLGARHPLVPPDGSWAAQQPNRRIEVRLID